MAEDKNKNSQQQAPHPKNEEELKKILESVDEIGGPKKAKVGKNWVVDGRECDF